MARRQPEFVGMVGFRKRPPGIAMNSERQDALCVLVSVNLRIGVQDGPSLSS